MSGQGTSKKELEVKLAKAMKDEGFPAWETHYCFNRPENGMTFDFAWPEYKVAVEVNGGQWSGGKMGHNSGTGVERDARKNNYAVLKGWLLIVLVTDHIDKRLGQYALPIIRETLLKRGADVKDFDKLLGVLFNEPK